MATNKRKLFIDVISDTICPWCYIGKRRLEKAMALVKDTQNVDFEVRWRPYFLNPSLPKEAQNKAEMYRQKFGAERYEKMVPYMQDVGRKEGINFSYGGTIANTRDSHRLVEYAFRNGGSEMENKVIDALFKGYFEEERNVADLEFLLEVATDAGLDTEKTRAYLESEEGTQQVDEDVFKYGRKFRVTGVPHFVISNDDGPQHAMGGAQEPETIVAVINRVLEED